MHNLYTTYFAKLKKINFENPTVKIIIMRMPPMAFLSYEGAIHAPSLSPHTDTLIKYKRDGDFEDFTKRFNEQLETDEETVRDIAYIIDCLESKDGNDICLICCEKDENLCHRHLIAKYIERVSGIKSREI